MTQKPNQPLIYLGVILCTFFWGTNFKVIQFTVQSMTPITATMERFVIAALSLTTISTLLRKLRWPVFRENFSVFIVLGLLGITVFSIAFAYGVQATTPVNAAIIMATTPLTTLLLAFFMENEAISLNRLIGIMLGLAGILVIITKGSMQALLALQIAKGDGIMFLASISWALYTVLSRRFLPNANPFEVATFSMLPGTAMLIAISMFLEHPWATLSAADASKHVAVFYAAFFGTTIAYLLWFNGVKYLGASRTSIFFNFVPIFALLTAIALGVIPTIWQIIGIFIVLVGALIATNIHK